MKQKNHYHEAYRPYFESSHKFIVNDRTTVCLFYHPDFPKPFVGKAVCGPIDDFSKEKGEYIAKLRAHIKYQNAQCKEEERVLERMLDCYKERREQLFARAEKLDRLYLRLDAVREV
jgi:hypothetical protein